jgi:hypothetical protein
MNEHVYRVYLAAEPDAPERTLGIFLRRSEADRYIKALLWETSDQPLVEEIKGSWLRPDLITVTELEHRRKQAREAEAYYRWMFARD